MPDNVRVRRDKTRKPKTSPENVEIAARLSGYYSGLDVAASAFYTWDDLPAYHRSLSYADGAVDIGYRPRHHRLTVYGLEFSRPWSDFVFRGEAAWYVGRYRESTATDPVQRDSLKWLLGLDWTPGDDWSIYAQFINESIFGNTAALTADPSDSLITLHVSKKLFNQTLTLSDMVYVDLNDGDFYNRIKAEYELRDGLFASVGLDVFCGGRDGQFGVYKDNSQAWCKIKYSF